MKTMFDGVDEFSRLMTYERQRQGVIAGNIANLDTPGYRPKDLVRADDTPFEAVLAATQPGHFQGAANAGDVRTVEVAGPVDPDGNAVSLEQEMVKMQMNRIRYEAAAKLVSGSLSDLSYTAGDGS